MATNTFFVCPNCGNVKKFKIFTSNFQVIEQSPEMGVRVGESGVLPSLRQNDNYVECQICFKKSDYDMVADIGKRYMQETLGVIMKTC
ncbi:MAG: hypothetical protein DYG83_17385 [Candidatus Brocadia sp. AMX2]|uniref:Uncharacterized protein n=1 Tax=Candidatus Brocadia sinica JPN1 TaxID=1197129 RepID=A0ABQ0JTQ6_9BACT|nr:MULTISPECIES: hypothetical protein [Brocadia]KXK31628.1 MAG: hypothetical protein UZ01_00826 [Candidatus Brocadia sinica]MBC6933982.1 hypothetical protein [Candidatus Brocadia sp.]MBL1170662.1 hypothetical protein [Candidatus Brocadia sp. AMX1]NOG40003.1 hypothetical protein [Planctomycetota bacterium]KAA0241468.1 MAG: hypothetical protein EDM70_18020 [Candidatus Brocadia sp. AMX2]